jgi:hypothetical protein
MSDVLDRAVDEPVPPRADVAAALAEQMRRLNLILRNAIARFRHRHSLQQRNGLNGVAVFDEEIDDFLNTSLEEVNRAEEPVHDQLRCELRAHASVICGIELPITKLQHRFGLSAIEFDALLHCLAVELHPGYGRVFAYLNNDLSRQRPSVALIIENLAATWAERLAARRTLGRRAPLFNSGLLMASRAGADHFTAELALAPEVLDFLLSTERRDEPGSSEQLDLDDLLVSAAERETIEQTTRYLQQALDHGSGSNIVALSGAPGVGRRCAAGAICHRLGYRLRVAAKHASAALVAADLPRWLRDVRMAGEVLGVYVSPGDEETQLPAVIAEIEVAECALAFVFLEAERPPRVATSGSARLLGLHLATPTIGLRTTAWRRALAARGLDCADDALATIAAVYPFNVGRISASAREAELRAQVADPAARLLTLPVLAQVCREQTHHRLDRLAQALPVRHEWADLVLPPDEMRRLKEIASAVRNRDHVMEEWGFDQKVSAGPGVNAVFFGPSGTGKTMAASILAGELGMAIYRVDLSRVVSKYIGETERNLDVLFEEARRSFAVLFFDEAEALFGKRSEVKDAHDRYANIEVAYLLQRMETFEGVAILATNLHKHMDNAFLRRLQFAVEFPLPTVTERVRIWRQVWPARAALDRDIDLDFMARHLELSGGHIRNVALMAAFLAWEERAPITMTHVMAATRREFQKLGRHWVAERFAPYASLLEPAS